jgi:hypothetical protein
VTQLGRIARTSLVAGTLLLTFAVLPGAVRAQCASPTATIERQPAAPGKLVVLLGKDWATQCNDVVVCTEGCFGQRCSGGEPAPAAHDLTVEIRKRGTGWRTIATGLDAESNYRLDARITLPADLPFGTYDLRVRGDGVSALEPDGLVVAVRHG